MAKLTPQQLKELYEKLPEDLREAIFSVDSTEAIHVAGQKYNLTVDKIGELADETGLVMLGLTHPKDFIANLAKRLNADKETARKIADEINTQIFSKVRESLKKIHGETSDVFPPTSDVKAREEILKEIEKPEMPEILQGMHEPPKPESSFELKTKEDIFRMPPVESKYPHGDPYREPIE